jgi:hypothetical protein
VLLIRSKMLLLLRIIASVETRPDGNDKVRLR